MDELKLSVMALEYDRDVSCAVVSLAGRAAIGDGAWLRLLLEMPAAQDAGRLIVDMSRLESMDWWVALTLLWASRVIRRRGGELIFAAPQPDVARLLDVLGAAVVVTVCESVQHATSRLACAVTAG